MPAEIRKTLLHVEETLIEGGKAAETPLKMIAAVAVIKNPWAGRGFVEDLKPEIHDCAPGLGEMLTSKLEAAEGRVQMLKNALRQNEVEVLLLLRLVPAVPFFVANLLPALVGVRFGNFLWTTALGIIPGAIVFTWIGVGVGEVFDRGEDPDLSLLWEPHVIAPLLGLCVLAAMPIIVKALRPKKKAS